MICFKLLICLESGTGALAPLPIVYIVAKTRAYPLSHAAVARGPRRCLTSFPLRSSFLTCLGDEDGTGTGCCIGARCLNWETKTVGFNGLVDDQHQRISGLLQVVRTKFGTYCTSSGMPPSVGKPLLDARRKGTSGIDNTRATTLKLAIVRSDHRRSKKEW